MTHLNDSPNISPQHWAVVLAWLAVTSPLGLLAFMWGVFYVDPLNGPSLMLVVNWLPLVGICTWPALSLYLLRLRPPGAYVLWAVILVTTVAFLLEYLTITWGGFFSVLAVIGVYGWSLLVVRALRNRRPTSRLLEGAVVGFGGLLVEYIDRTGPRANDGPHFVVATIFIIVAAPLALPRHFRPPLWTMRIIVTVLVALAMVGATQGRECGHGDEVCLSATCEDNLIKLQHLESECDSERVTWLGKALLALRCFTLVPYRAMPCDPNNIAF